MPLSKSAVDTGTTNSNTDSKGAVFEISEEHASLNQADIDTILPVIDYILSKTKLKDEQIILQDLPKLLNSLIKMTTFTYIMSLNMAIKQNTNNVTQQQTNTESNSTNLTDVLKRIYS